MADSTEGTAGQVIQGIGPALSAVPYVGPLLSMGASIGGGLLQADAAKKQQQQGMKQQQEALATPLTPLRPEFLAALHNQMLQAHSDMPGFEANKDILSQQLADQIRGIRMSSPNGDATLAAIGNAMASRNKDLMQLGAQNSAYRVGEQDKANQTLWNVGTQGVANEAIQRQQKQAGLTSAAQMLNAAMLNKQTGANQILGGISAAGTSLEKNALLKQAYDAGTGTGTRSLPTTGATGGINYGFNTNQNLSNPWQGTPSPLLDTTHSSLFQNGQLTPAGQQYYLGAPGTTPNSYLTNSNAAIGSSTPSTTSYQNPFASPIVPDNIPSTLF